MLFDQLKRREFLTLFGSAVAVWPLETRAQQPDQLRRVGFLVSSEPIHMVNSDRIAAFRQRLRELGYVEGRDIVLEFRTAEGRVDRMPALAEELVRLNPDVIVTGTTAAAIAAKNATSTIPIVSALLSDPIGFGLVASHARPGGNVTGNLITIDTLPGKHLELARDLLPGALRIGMLVNALNPTNSLQRRNAEGAAATVNVVFVPIEVRAPDEIDAAFQTLVRARVEFVLVPTDTMFFSQRERVATLAIAARLPSIYPWREHVEAGGLMSYGTHMRENYRNTANFVDKILRGARPGDLPVELQTRFELVVNLKTAKAIGLVIPESFLLRADEVIE